MSLAKDLCLGTVDTIVSRTGLVESTGADGGPFHTLTSPMSPDPVGALRVWTGGKGVAKAVYCGLAVDAIGLDSHMVFAFTDSDSLVPHFTLDSVFGQGSFAFHLDLIPRLELASHLAYVDAAFTPLTEFYEDVQGRAGLTPAAIGPRQRAMMSPWMCVSRATDEAFTGMGPVVTSYLEHWFSLLDGGLPQDVLDSAADTDVERRDLANRAALFSPEVDPVWNQIARLIGDQSEIIRTELVRNT
jgi:hypothetical protein